MIPCWSSRLQVQLCGVLESWDCPVQQMDLRLSAVWLKFVLKAWALPKQAYVSKLLSTSTLGKTIHLVCILVTRSSPENLFELIHHKQVKKHKFSTYLKVGCMVTQPHQMQFFQLDWIRSVLDSKTVRDDWTCSEFSVWLGQVCMLLNTCIVHLSISQMQWNMAI